MGYLNSLYAHLFYSIRVNSTAGQKLYNHLKEHKAWRFTSSESFDVVENTLPTQETAIYWLKVPFSFAVSEKYLTSGGEAKEKQVFIYTLRFFRKAVINILKEANKIEDERDYIDINLNIDYTSYRTTNRIKKKDAIGQTILSENIYDEISSVFEDIDNGRRKKSGIILTGDPGTGKTSIIKEMAARFDYDIYVPLFQSSHYNKDIVAIFDNVPKFQKSILLLEDFDSIFVGRQNQLREANFTLDVLLNILDGAYLDMSNKIVILTCNSIEKIDDSLRRRPSRFDYLFTFKAPTYDLRVKILELGGLNGLSYPIAKMTEGCSGAILREIARRRITEDNFEQEVKDVISTFKEPESLGSVLTEKTDDLRPATLRTMPDEVKGY